MDRSEALWSSFAVISAELVDATHGVRDGTATEEDIVWLRTELAAIEADLAELAVEPDCVVSG
jgi:hypothetical protein